MRGRIVVGWSQALDPVWPDATTSRWPVPIVRNAWVGFQSCLLPGITVGEGAIVGARSVVADDVPPFCVVVGNPALIVQQLQPEST
jgi:acetyltransferase-like isoleucine patch superfamily enzyme